MNNHLKFSGIERLLTKEAVANLHRSHALVVGVGGVGSWAVESLARSGVGKLSFIDYDEICVSNFNRQIHSLDGTVGKFKVEVLKERVLAINPQCEVNTITDFFTPENAETVLSQGFDVIIDAIDSIKPKALLAFLCKTKNIPLIVTGGAGGKTDPTQIRIEDLGLTINDPLLQKLRKTLRQNYEFPRGKKKKFHVHAVYSPQIPVLLETCQADGGLDCSNGYGTASYVTATFGFFAAYKAVDILVQKSVAKSIEQ